MTGIHVTRSMYVEAPPAVAPYAKSTYVSRDGCEVLERVKYQTMTVQADGRKHYHEQRGYFRRSLDNGVTWKEEGASSPLGPQERERLQVLSLGLILDPRTDMLIDLFLTNEFDVTEGMFKRGNRIQRTQRTWYRLSADGGRTWGDVQQVIDSRTGYDETHWAPGTTWGQEGGRATGQHLFLPDGDLVMGFTFMHPEVPATYPPDAAAYYVTIRYARARFNGDCSALEWRFGDEIAVDFPQSTMGAAEPALTRLADGRLYNTMRCQGSKEHGTYAVRYCTLSSDEGVTWTEPEPLVYDDGSTVWTPASPHRFFTSSKTGKTYLLANILDAPVYHQHPRYPLAIAEFDPEAVCVRRDTVEVIQDLPPGAPTERRYTNFSMREERGTGDLLLVMPEQPREVDYSDMTDPEQFTADCFQWRVALLD